MVSSASLGGRGRFHRWYFEVVDINRKATANCLLDLFSTYFPSCSTSSTPSSSSWPSSFAFPASSPSSSSLSPSLSPSLRLLLRLLLLLLDFRSDFIFFFLLALPLFISYRGRCSVGLLGIPERFFFLVKGGIFHHCFINFIIFHFSPWLFFLRLCFIAFSFVPLIISPSSVPPLAFIFWRLLAAFPPADPSPPPPSLSCPPPAPPPSAIQKRYLIHPIHSVSCLIRILHP